jgi:hypothetical protein
MTSAPGASTAEPVRGARAWVPTSWLAFGLFAAIALLMAPLTVVALFVADAYYTGCVLKCETPNHTAAATSVLLAVLFAAMPFAAVRVYQSRRPTPAGTQAVRLLLVVVLLIAVPVAHAVGLA